MKASKFMDAQKAFNLKQGSEGMPTEDNGLLRFLGKETPLTASNKALVN